MTDPHIQLCIVGGGPAGMMAGYLFARAGVQTLVLEKHGDFLRDFRGDTVHPSTLDLFGELGLLDRLLARPHAKVETVSAVVGGRTYRIGDFTRLPPPGRFIAMMPQWEFLDFLAREAATLSAFRLRMETAVAGLAWVHGRVVGVSTAAGETIRADYVIAADGRNSLMRDEAHLPFRDLGAPIDVFWFRVPKEPTPDNLTQGYVDRGQMVVVIDRGDYYQCARVIGKGEAEAVRAAGIERFRADVVATAPVLAGAVDAVASFEDVKLLSVSLDRLTRWNAPGLLAIGDATHAMSPVGGVGINLAIQVAVAAANILAAPLAAGRPVDALAAKVQRRRMLPVRFIQGLQRAVHQRVIGSAFRNEAPRAGALLQLVSGMPVLQTIPARILGLGLRREHIRSPRAERFGLFDLP